MYKLYYYFLDLIVIIFITIGKYSKISPYMAMKEIFDNGPITTQFYMYRDLVDYKSGM